MRMSRTRCLGFTLMETLLVVAILSLFVMWAMPNLTGTLRRNTFRAAVQDFTDTLQRAATAAAESDRRYEVSVNIAQQTYMLREITSPQLSDVLQEEILTDGEFGRACRVVYIEFDDGASTREGSDVFGGVFRVGKAGWSYGAKIVLVDEDDHPFTVLISRLNRWVGLREGEVELMTPKDQEAMMF